MKNKPWLTVQNNADATDFVISGPIGASWYDDSGTTSKEFREKFNAVPKGQKVNVRINSEGGSVGDALEIYNVLQSRKADVTCFNDGYCISSASIILLGGGRSVTPKSSIVMIHEPWSMTVGDEAAHLKSAEMLAKHGDTIAGIYSAKTGKSLSSMRDAMKKETWLTGDEAVEFGLGDDDGDGDIDPNKEDPQDRITRLKNFLSQNVPRQILNIKPISAPAQADSGAVKPNDASLQAGIKPKDSMDKKAILALLKTHGIELPESATEQQILDALGAISSKADEITKTQAAKLKEVQDQLDSEKKIRITAEVKRRSEGKIENAKLDWWINLALKDEAGTLAQIDSLPRNMPGGEPIGSGLITIENRLEEIKKERNATKRYNILRAEYDGIMKDALVRDQRMGIAGLQPVGNGGSGQRLYPMNSNSYSATLVTQFLLDGAVTKLQNVWAPLRIFTRDYSQDRYKPRATAQLKFVTTYGTTQKNASSFESGDATVTNTQIAVDQYTTAFHVTNDELNSGLRMENLVDIKTAECADNILKIAFSPLDTTALTTNAKIIRGATAFGFSDMAQAWGQLKKSPIKYAVLDGEYLARILNQPTLFQAAGTDSGGGWKQFGWDGVYSNTNWTGTHAGANDQFIRGLFCNPQIMGAVAGLPLTPPSIPGNTLTESTITVPGVDISIAAYSWFSLATRTFWMSYDLMFGSALLDESAGVALTSA